MTTPTYRQVRLLAWLHDPQPRDRLPQHEAIRWEDAFWSAAEIVELTDIYSGPRARDACLRDLNDLARMGKIRKWPNEAKNLVRWQYGEWP